MLARAIRRILYLAVLLAGAVQAAPLPPARARVLREQFQAHQQQTKTWSASFTQTLALAGMRQTVVSTGTLAYRAHGELRLDFTKPGGEFVLVAGDRLFLQKAGKALAVGSLSDDSAGKPFRSLLGLLSGRPADEERLYAPEVSREDRSYLIVLNRKPDSSSRLPKRITNTIDVDSLEVREVFVELPEGSTLKYRFDAVMRNRAIGAARFAPPESRLAE